MSSSSLNHQATNGFPVCLAGIMRPPLPLSKEFLNLYISSHQVYMVSIDSTTSYFIRLSRWTDHIGRREAMKKLRAQMGGKWNTDQVRSHGRDYREKISEADADLIAALLSDLCLSCTAKAA